MLLPEVLGKLAETPGLAPAPARETQSLRVPQDDLDRPHLRGLKQGVAADPGDLEF